METLKLRIEKEGRAGKTVTVIAGFTREKRLMAEATSMLKRRFGCGGTFNGGEIVLQGDLRVRVRPLLKQLGYGVKG
jgi:translation initiation factor 1